MGNSLRGIVISSEIIVIRIKQRNVLKSNMQRIVRRESVNLGGNLEDIINFAEVQRISIYQ
jgi:hypothetical protein